MKITVTRFDPSQDASPYEQSFEVPYRDNITALEALMHIYENEEPIAFDYSCHGRSCGRCAMMVDGEPKLACIAGHTELQRPQRVHHSMEYTFSWAPMSNWLISSRSMSSKRTRL